MSNEEGIFLTGTDVNSSSWATLAMCWIRSYLICMFISVSLISFSYQYKCNFIIIICTLNKHEFIGVLNSLECSSCIFFLEKKSIFLKVLIFWSIKKYQDTRWKYLILGIVSVRVYFPRRWNAELFHEFSIPLEQIYL